MYSDYYKGEAMNTRAIGELTSDERQFASITDDGLEALRRLIGIKITDTIEPWCSEVTRDSIRHYAHGIGDDNPLWCDPSYAGQTRYGGLIAPPSFVFPLNRIYSGYVGGLPGVHAMWSGADTTWHRPFAIGDQITTEAYLKDLVPHETRFAGRAIQQIYHVDFFANGDELVASGDSWCFRTERDTARELGTKYEAVSDADVTPLSDEVLAQVWQSYESERVRGSEARYAEDVTVGEQLPPMVKGPMTVTGFIAFAQGWGGLYIRANRIAYKQIKKHPGLGIPNKYGIPDVPERVHWDDDLAQLVGTPRAYDYGPERCSWLLHHLTDWIGDDGFVQNHHCQIRRHNVVGEIVHINGVVTDCVAESNGTEFEITQTATNQDGELSATAVGRVRLPTRN
jgi:acyl dehydratase